jgi:hypothetical protein
MTALGVILAVALGVAGLVTVVVSLVMFLSGRARPATTS